MDRRGITADTAVRLGRYFGNRAQFWLDLQSQYDIVVIERKRAPRSRGACGPPMRRDGGGARLPDRGMSALGLRRRGADMAR
jgi:hypothetical protein